MKTRHMFNAAMAAMLLTAAPMAFALGTSSTESAKLSSSFSTWAGGKSNSDSLVGGLRNSSTIHLTTTTNGKVSTATFTPTTKPMGFGNVKLALSLAKRSLANLGITNPTAEQMQAALMGGAITLPNGTTTNIQGVDQLRASGMGWGQISKQFNTKLGPVASEGKASGTATAMGAANAPGHSGIATGMSNANVAESHSAFGASHGQSPSAPGSMSGAGQGIGAGPSFGPQSPMGGAMGGAPGQSGESHGKGKGGG